MNEPEISKATDGLVHEKLVTREEAVMLSSEMRNNGSKTLGAILTLVEAALGDTVQAKSLKSAIKKEMYTLIDLNQQFMYVTTGQQTRVLAQITHYEITNE